MANTYKACSRKDRNKQTSAIKAANRTEALKIASAILKTTSDDIILIRARIISCPRCHYRWSFKGFREIYAACPQCLRQIKLKDTKI